MVIDQLRQIAGNLNRQRSVQAIEVPVQHPQDLLREVPTVLLVVTLHPQLLPAKQVPKELLHCLLQQKRGLPLRQSPKCQLFVERSQQPPVTVSIILVQLLVSLPLSLHPVPRQVLALVRRLRHFKVLLQNLVQLPTPKCLCQH